MWNKNIEECILFEDNEILVCHKPAGLAVQNSRMGSMDMESALKNYLAKKDSKHTPWLGVIHRLDQPVEGVVVFAKTSTAAAKLNRQMTGGSIGKIYLAVTDQAVEEKKGTRVDYLLKDGRKNLSSVVSEKTKGAKKAILDYEILKKIQDEKTSSGYRYLVKIKLDTGRHHQIRVQMSHAGMPLVGDRKYYFSDVSGFSLGLCSCYLSFRHPANGKKMEFQVIPKGDTFKGFELL